MHDAIFIVWLQIQEPTFYVLASFWVKLLLIDFTAKPHA